MSNFLGKAIVEGKKIVDSITEKATPVVTEAVKNFKEQSADLTSKAKRAIDISVLKAEIEDLYLEFGKATFEWGLMPSNEKALEIMKVLYEKTDLLEKLEAEIAAEKEAKEVNVEETEEEGPEVVVTEEKSSCETPAEEKPVETVEDKAEVKPKTKTSAKKPKTKKAEAPVEDKENKKPLDK